MTHPKSQVYVSGRPYSIPCDCWGCERRHPMLGAGVVLLISGLLAGLAGLLMQGC